MCQRLLTIRPCGRTNSASLKRCDDYAQAPGIRCQVDPIVDATVAVLGCCRECTQIFAEAYNLPDRLYVEFAEGVDRMDLETYKYADALPRLPLAMVENDDIPMHREDAAFHWPQMNINHHSARSAYNAPRNSNAINSAWGPLANASTVQQPRNTDWQQAYKACNPCEYQHWPLRQRTGQSAPPLYNHRQTGYIPWAYEDPSPPPSAQNVARVRGEVNELWKTGLDSIKPPQLLSSKRNNSVVMTDADTSTAPSKKVHFAETETAQWLRGQESPKYQQPSTLSTIVEDQALIVPLCPPQPTQTTSSARLPMVVADTAPAIKPFAKFQPRIEDAADDDEL